MEKEKKMADCKWCQDEICVNADCPMCCDYCPVPDIDGVCRFEDREGKEIESEPEIDAVPVVRCDDCIGKSIWYNDAEYGFVICGMSGMYPKSENDFCSYGERK